MTGDHLLSFSGVIYVLINHLCCNSFIRVLIFCDWAFKQAVAHSASSISSLISKLHALLLSWLDSLSYKTSVVYSIEICFPCMCFNTIPSRQDSGGSRAAWWCFDEMKCVNCKYLKKCIFGIEYFRQRLLNVSKVPSTYKSPIFCTPLLAQTWKPPSALPGMNCALSQIGENWEMGGVSPICLWALNQISIEFLRKGFVVFFL